LGSSDGGGDHGGRAALLMQLLNVWRRRRCRERVMLLQIRRGGWVGGRGRVRSGLSSSGGLMGLEELELTELLHLSGVHALGWGASEVGSALLLIRRKTRGVVGGVSGRRAGVLTADLLVLRKMEIDMTGRRSARRRRLVHFERIRGRTGREAAWA
jgi:hypothetical protein